MSESETPTPLPDTQAALPPVVNHRLSKRRPITRKIGIAFRKGALGLGPDLAVRLLDVSEDGLGACIKAEVPVGLEVLVELSASGVQKPIKLLGEVRWCKADPDGTFHVGVRLHKRLAYKELNDLARLHSSST